MKSGCQKKQRIQRNGAATRCIEENDKSIVKADTKIQSLTLASGKILSYQMLNGVILHGGKTTELQDYQVVTTLEKSMTIIILLEGQLTFRYDDLDIQLDDLDNQTGIAVNFCKPVCFSRNFTAGNEVTKLNLYLPASWLETFLGQDNQSRHLIEKHLAARLLTITPTMKEAAQKVLDIGSSHFLIDKMKMESYAQSLLINIFEQLLTHDDGIETVQHLNENESEPCDHILDEVIKYIELNIDKNLTPSHLSDIAVMSVSNLQRRFKKSSGYSVQSYIRRRRLDLARQQIERGLISITEAAYRCGYRYPSSFTNAYKKAFGYPPLMTVSK